MIVSTEKVKNGQWLTKITPSERAEERPNCLCLTRGGGGGGGDRETRVQASSANLCPFGSGSSKCFSVRDLAVIWGIEGDLFILLIKTEYLLGVKQLLSPGNYNTSKKVTPSANSQGGQEDN